MFLCFTKMLMRHFLIAFLHFVPKDFIVLLHSKAGIFMQLVLQHRRAAMYEYPAAASGQTQNRIRNEGSYRTCGSESTLAIHIQGRDGETPRVAQRDSAQTARQRFCVLLRARSGEVLPQCFLFAAWMASSEPWNSAASRGRLLPFTSETPNV